MTPITPNKTKSPLAWLGGKSRLANEIIQRIPTHTAYIEVFAGAAWVLFKKPESRVEIINDINKDLITLYRCVKHHLPALVEQFKWILVSRDEFERFIRTPPDTLTDIQRAARFLYISKSSFGSRLTSPSWGVATTTHPRLNLLRIEEDLSQAHLRLSRAHIECKPYQEVITRFDKTNNFFYIDPPYWDCENDYGKGIFSKQDFGTLAGLLDKVQGKFIMSLNDTKGVRDTFSNFTIEEVKTRYSVSAGKNMEVGELLIKNF